LLCPLRWIASPRWGKLKISEGVMDRMIIALPQRAPPSHRAEFSLSTRARGEGTCVAASTSTTGELADLLRRVAAEDREAFQMLFRATSAKLYGIVFRILRRKDLADEIVQEAYLRVWRRAASFNPAAGSPITWMAVIARNLALDEVRRVQPVSIEDRPEVMDLADEFNHPLDARERSETWARLMTCLEGIEKDKREMVLLAYHHGMSREDLAAKFGAPVATVKTWLRRTLLQLRACLGHDGA
jgi:RNA polymerase sigma-70 factor (ECF subfamily)